MLNHSLIASIANGFKAPTLQQLYLDTSGNTVDEWDTIPNADLEAETAVNMELAYEFRYGSNRLRLTWEPIFRLPPVSRTCSASSISSGSVSETSVVKVPLFVAPCSEAD